MNHDRVKVCTPARRARCEHLHCSCGMEKGSAEAYGFVHAKCACGNKANVSHCCFSGRQVEHEYLVSAK